MREVGLKATIGAALGGALLVLACPMPAIATFPGINGKIAYEMAGNIFTVSPTGGTPAQLTTGGGSYHPAWSPRGDQIAFNRNKSLFVMAANGAGQRRVPTGNVVVAANPTWSPDETQIAFAGQDGNLYRVGSGTGASAVIQMTRDQTRACHPFDEYPNWSPTGQEIVFIRQCTAGSPLNDSVTLLDLSSLTEKPILATPSYLYHPRFTSDGTWIDLVTSCLYPSLSGCTYKNTQSNNIVQIEKDGSGWTFLTNFDSQSESAADDPGPSPDGTTFAWTIEDYGNPNGIAIGVPRYATILARGSEPDWQRIAG